ncbi:hypothetical protein [Yinghuangia aomiensis]
MIRPHSAYGVSAAALAALLVLAGCSSGSDDKKSADPAASVGSASGGGSGPAAAEQAGADGRLAIPAGADDETKKQYMVTNAVAECMKKAGFAYVPFVLTPTSANRDDNDRDYASARKIREKYGFGAFAPDVYPNDPQAPGSKTAVAEDPNTAAFQALPQDRKDAWNAAMMGSTDPAKMKQAMADGGGCLGAAQTKVYGDKGKSKADAEAASEAARRNRLNLNGDPELSRLAQGFASCLRGKGYPVETTAVTEIRNAERFVWMGKAAQLNQNRPQPADVDQPARPQSGPTLDPATARTMLTQEIQAALADLDCGRDFRAAYYPKLDKAPGAEGAG